MTTKKTSNLPAFARGVHLRTADSTHNVPVMTKAFPYHNVIISLTEASNIFCPKNSERIAIRAKIHTSHCYYDSAVAMSYRCLLKQHWKPTVAMVPTLTSPTAPVAAITTMSGASSAKYFGIMTTLGFQRTRLMNAPTICYVSLHDRVIQKYPYRDYTMNLLIKSAERKDHTKSGHKMGDMQNGLGIFQW